ncbi:MBL fold metallo-hydrolase [Desulfofundulus thermobenzoicus]|uniref:MBL fold metallo-hydrolase n=1 Tax=Desulfofundulus thermobenzoicus TaxID=29376 RepID=A0A6N7INK5_9FIRM|nr:MBL fold metallo-hydrolase [Desulfofundulus thermobenzoicus]MQL51596.1 MBL fold metallo-hydrolase [Desulfofundulus thermobenzoicus]
MQIHWLGHACFLVTTGSGKRIITDPFDQRVGYPPPAVPADIVTVSHQHFDHNAVQVVPGSPAVVQETGEHVFGDIKITGHPSYHDQSRGSQRGENIIFVIETEGLRLCHVGDLGHRLEDDRVKALGEIDILMIPVGGYYTIDAAEAAAVVEQLAPAYVLPMHYKTASLDLPIAPVDHFLRYFPEHEEREVLIVEAGNLPVQMRVVRLTLFKK